MSRTVPVVDYARFPARVRMLLEVDGYEAIGEVADRATAMTKVGGCVQVWCCSTYSFPSGDGFDVAVHFTGDPDGRRSC